MSRILQRNIRVEKQGIFLSTGLLTVSISVPLGPSWEIRQISVKTNITSVNTSCETRIGTSSAGVFISSTVTGNSDTDSEPNVTLRPGESICALWALGTVGSIGRLTVIYDEVDY